MNAMSTFHRRCLELASQNWTEGDDECAATIDYAIDISGTVFDYDVSINDADFEGIYHEDDVKNYIMNSTKMNDLYKALHIDKSTKVPVFKWSCRECARALDHEDLVDWTPWYDLVAGPKNVSILIYAGDYDMLDGPQT
jgi:hypothetical protein